MVSFFSLFVSCNKTSTIPDVVGKCIISCVFDLVTYTTASQSVFDTVVLLHHQLVFSFFVLLHFFPCHCSSLNLQVFPSATVYARLRSSSKMVLCLLLIDFFLFTSSISGLSRHLTWFLISCCGRPREKLQPTSITSGVSLESTTSALEQVTTVSTRTSSYTDEKIIDFSVLIIVFAHHS